MRRAGLTALAITVILVATTAIASAKSALIRGKADNTFDAPSYSHDAGTFASFSAQLGSTHNVTATGSGPDRKPLFRTENITGGGPGPPASVSGTEYLPSGSYPFICTLHPATMSATLVVTGTPQPRPTVTTNLLTKKLSQAAKGRLFVKVTTTGFYDVNLEAKLGSKTIGTGIVAALSVPLPGTEIATVNLSKSGKRALAKTDSAKITITAATDFAAPSSVRAKLK